MTAELTSIMDSRHDGSRSNSQSVTVEGGSNFRRVETTSDSVTRLEAVNNNSSDRFRGGMDALETSFKDLKVASS